jgi:hypothetical protein
MIAASNMYLGLKTGFTFGASLVGAIFGFAIIKPMSQYLPWFLGGGGYFGPKENCTVCLCVSVFNRLFPFLSPAHQCTSIHATDMALSARLVAWQGAQVYLDPDPDHQKFLLFFPRIHTSTRTWNRLPNAESPSCLLPHPDNYNPHHHNHHNHHYHGIIISSSLITT